MSSPANPANIAASTRLDSFSIQSGGMNKMTEESPEGDALMSKRAIGSGNRSNWRTSPTINFVGNFVGHLCRQSLSKMAQFDKVTPPPWTTRIKSVDKKVLAESTQKKPHAKSAKAAKA